MKKKKYFVNVAEITASVAEKLKNVLYCKQTTCHIK